MVYRNFGVWLIVKLLLIGCVLSCAKPYYKPPEVSTLHSVGIKRQQAAFQEKVQYEKRQVIRLADLSFPLMRASVHFINSLGNIKRKYGFHYSSQDSWDWSKIARYNRIVIYEAYGISDSRSEMSIWHVVKGSPAEEAGLLIGDRIIALDGKSFETQKKFAKILEQLTEKSRRHVRHKRSDGTTETRLVWVPVDFTVKRKTKDGVKVLTLPVETKPVGNFETLYLNERTLNAYANGRNVFITEGMMDFVRTDEELQFVIAHELAHNIGKHLEKRKNNAFAGAMLGSVLGGVAGGITGKNYSDLGRSLEAAGMLAYSKDFEREADYLGMYILANAGVQFDQVHKFWERMNAKRKESGTFNSTHPSDAERIEALKIISVEIEHKKLSDERLMPNTNP